MPKPNCHLKLELSFSYVTPQGKLMSHVLSRVEHGEFWFHQYASTIENKQQHDILLAIVHSLYAALQ